MSAMETTRVQSLTARVAPFSLETSFRRTSTSSTQSFGSQSISSQSISSFDRDSIISRSSSPVDAINSIVFSYAQQPTPADADDVEHAEQVAGILEPRPNTAQIISMEQLLRSY